MKFLKKLDNPMFYTVSAVSIQLVFVVLFLYYLSSYSATISVLYIIVNILIVLFLISKDDNPSYKVIWIIIILGVPMVGGILYILFGNKRASRRMAVRITDEQQKYLNYINHNEDITNRIKLSNSRAAGSIHYLQNECNFPVWENTETNYYPSGEELYASMLLELKKAKKFIFMEYFIIEQGIMWNGIYEILKNKAAQGVDVRVMYDDLGCANLLPKDFVMQLNSNGIKCLPFNEIMPFLNFAMNNRDHRKITVIDGNVAFSGGVNLADEYINEKLRFGHWKDTGIKIEGAAVWNFTMMFLEFWNAFTDSDMNIQKYRPEAQVVNSIQSKGYVQPFSDSPMDDEATSQNVYMDILNQAKDYVYIFTPYLIIDNEMRNALCMAVKRGVDVHLVTPGIPDKKLVFRITRANYTPLLAAGVKIHEYAPGFLHAKSFVCDDEIAVVGTINLDFRSLYLHFECGLLLLQTNSVLDIKEDFVKTIQVCREIKLSDLRQSFFWRLFDTVIRAFSPLM